MGTDRASCRREPRTAVARVYRGRVSEDSRHARARRRIRRSQTAGRGVSGRHQMIRAVPSRIATAATTQARNKTAGFGRVEDFAITLTLSAMMLLPLGEIVLRRTLHTGIGASIIVQHLAFIAGMLGGAIAAREGRMLALSTLGESLLGGRL